MLKMYLVWGKGFRSGGNVRLILLIIIKWMEWIIIKKDNLYNYNNHLPHIQYTHSAQNYK